MDNELAKLRRFVADHFSLEEIRTLCFDLGIDYEELGGEGRSAQTREILEWLGRNRKLEQLLVTLQRERSELFAANGFRISGAFVEQLYRQLPAAAETEMGDGPQARVSTGGAASSAGGAHKSMGRWKQGRLLAVAIAALLLVSVAVLPGLLRDADEQPDEPAEAIASDDTHTVAAETPEGSSRSTDMDVTAPVAPSPAATAAPLSLDIPGAPLTITWLGGSFQHTLQAAQLQRSAPGRWLLTLYVSAWTNAAGGMNFWSDSFRLHADGRSLAPVNDLNELVPRDTTVEGEVKFELDDWLEEGVLVLSFAGEREDVPLTFPEPSPAPTATATSPTSSPVELPLGTSAALFVSGGRIEYTLLSAGVELSSPGRRLLSLRVRVLNDFGNINFWSDTFRLVTGGRRLAPVNDLNKVAGRDETVDGDVQFEVDEEVHEANLEISVSGEVAELPLIIPSLP